MVPPFDHKDIIEGQATVAYEIAGQMPGGRMPDIMVLPVGGGGLAAGVTHYFHEQRPRHAFRVLRAGRRAEPQRKPCRRPARETRQGRQFRRRRGGRRDRPRAVPASQGLFQLTRCG